MKPGLIYTLLIVALVVAALWLLGRVLTPFLVGFAVAYLLDPPVQRLQRRGVNRGVAAFLVIFLFFLASGVVLVFLGPVLETQLVGLVQRLIEAARDLIERARPYIEQVLSETGAPGGGSLGSAGDIAGKVANSAIAVIVGLWSGGLAVVNVISLMLLTPVVAFYLLRDWPAVVARIDAWLPRDQAVTVRNLLRQIDERLAGFMRGQALVCLILGVFYAAGLTLSGLNYGLIVGLLSGVLTVIPFVGAIVGAGAAIIIAAFQFDDWVRVAIVAAVYAVGQFLESNVLSPKLVGERIGLHPVWLIFALLAGGELFGFVGVLLSVPAAATIGVLARFGVEHYLASPFFRGGRGSGGGGR